MARFSLVLILLCMVAAPSDALTVDYYAQTCPQAEAAISQAVRMAVARDKTVPAALLRMHFHDCFIRGCDGSVLLDSTPNNKAEKDGPPNLSLHAFYVIDNAKKAVEKLCPGVVSCADILAVAARDVVYLSGGPSWEVPKGRKDGRISKDNDTIRLPFPTFNFSQLKQSFAQRGLSVKDLVALSGGHTLGFAHCSSFQNRIHGFSKTLDVDPTLEASFAANLRGTCPLHNKVRSAGANMDPTVIGFDNLYFRGVVAGKVLFSSDQALLQDPTSAAIVKSFASSTEEFFQAFVESMIRMGSIPGNGVEVRTDCRVIR